MRKLPILFFFCLLTISAQNLEDEIYTALDSFLENPSETAFQKLTNQEKQFQTKLVTKNEHLAFVILQCNKAYHLKEDGRFLSAIDVYENAWQRFNSKELSRYDIIEYCLKPLGNLYIKTNNYSSAEATIKLYISKAEKEKNRHQRIAGIINLCLLYQTIHKHKTVVKIIDQTLQLYEIGKEQKDKLLSIRNNSSLHIGRLSGNFGSNYVQYKQKLLEKEFTKAYFFFKKAKEDVSQSSLGYREQVKWVLEEAQLLLFLNKSEEAKSMLNEVLHSLLPKNSDKDYANLYPESLLIDVFDLKAQLEEDAKLSLRYYDKSFFVEDLLKNQTTTQQSKLFYQVNSRKRSEKCIELSLQEYFKTNDNDMLHKALHYANKGKYHLVNTKRNIEKLRNNNPNDSLLILEKELQLRKENIISKFQGKDSLDIYYSLFSSINRELKNVNQKLANKYPNLHRDSVDVNLIHDKAAEVKATFVMYFYGKSNIYQFIIDAYKVKIHSIELTTQLKEDIIQYIRFFRSPSKINNDVTAYKDLAFKLYKNLELDKLESSSKIALVTDGILSFLPFETLLTEKTETVFFSKMPFLVKEKSITYNFNLLMFLNEDELKEEFTVAGFFPVFKNSEKALLFSEEEAEAIKSNFESTLYYNEDASLMSFVRELNEKDIVHVSTHSENIGISSEAFIDFYDEKLYLNKLYSLNTKANLVVLSACETGVGSVIKGEGPMSLARGFSYIGSENLLFTLWKVNDKSSSEIIGSFYNSLKTRLDVSEANHLAKIEYLNNSNIDNAHKSPYYWGAFVYYGVITPKESSNELLFLFFGVLLLFMIFLQLRKQMK
ncbi:CHAT domain-containing protein [Tenacibaculum sp. MEBiC06402]|uniref:CHAT domain-containing protein n=1 Tax=unclassified Tenacibaculum TaxID=2635139 RepID=UPI003B9DB4B3